MKCYILLTSPLIDGTRKEAHHHRQEAYVHNLEVLLAAKHILLAEP